MGNIFIKCKTDNKPYKLKRQYSIHKREDPSSPNVLLYREKAIPITVSDKYTTYVKPLECKN